MASLLNLIQAFVNKSGSNQQNTNTNPISGLANMLGGTSNSSAGGLGQLLAGSGLGSILGNNLNNKNIGLLGVGAAALAIYQQWQNSNAQNQNMQNMQNFTQGNVNNFAGSQNQMALNDNSKLIIRAMVYASKADGNIDADEVATMQKIISKMLPNADVNALINTFKQEPLDPNVLAQNIRGTSKAHDVYRISCMVIDIDHFMERSYMDALATSLGIDKQSATQIEQEAKQAKQYLTA